MKFDEKLHSIHTPPPLLEDGLEFAPNEIYEFQTGSGIIIEKVRFSENDRKSKIF